MKLPIHNFKIAVDEREGNLVFTRNVLFARLAPMPIEANDNASGWGAHWFLEAGFGHDEREAAVYSLADWRYLAVRI